MKQEEREGGRERGREGGRERGRERGREGEREGGRVVLRVHMGKQNICGATLLYTAAVYSNTAYSSACGNTVVKIKRKSFVALWVFCFVRERREWNHCC